METTLTEKQKDSLKRILGMRVSDIKNMPYEYMIKLMDDFQSELLIREAVARGRDKDWQMDITNHLKDVYESWLYRMEWPLCAVFKREGHDEEIRGWFKAIEYDVHSNCLITSQAAAIMQPAEEEETDDEEPEDNEELEDLREQVEKIRSQEKGISFGINQAQAALFGLSLANAFGFNCKNKKKQLAPVLHKLFGWGEVKIARCLSEPCSKEERDELANLFKDLSPLLYKTIMNRGERPPEVTPEVTP